MKRLLILGIFVLLQTPLFADMPELQFDGTYSKTSPYKDPHTYSKMDFRAAQKNPLGLGLKKKVSPTDENFSNLEAKIDGYQKKEVQERLKKAYYKEVKREFDLTEKEKKAHSKAFYEFYKPDPPKKRIFISQILKLGDKEFPFENCSFAGEGDLNGDGVKEILTIWHDPATHSGACDGFRLFDEKGAFLWTFAPAPYVHEYAILDIDGDNRDEFLYTLGSDENKHILVIGCPRQGETLSPAPKDFHDSGHLSEKKEIMDSSTEAQDTPTSLPPSSPLLDNEQ